MKRFFPYGVSIISLLAIYIVIHVSAKTTKNKSETRVQAVSNLTENDRCVNTIDINDINATSNPINQNDHNVEQPIPEKLSDEKFVITLAKNAIGNSVAIPHDCKTEVERKDNAIIITFIYSLTKGTRGPDYYARVKLDAKSGRVISILSQD